MYNNEKPRKTMLDGELRDLFATAALFGLAGELSATGLRREDADVTAKAAYELADAMVRRRKLNKDEVYRQRVNDVADDLPPSPRPDRRQAHPMFEDAQPA